tara:strand:+ start:102 stop:1793 length:1692 start_codon:yes stop_codon:yes gene_type:complete
MAYDLVIENGYLIDGSGRERYRADVAVRNGKIVAIGDLDERARKTIDADGHIVCPGFVDGHTHMDAQVFWDPIGSSSCYHGVTSVVMGNCGFTLAPCKHEDADMVFRNLERAEDLSREAMLAGIDWSWETFPQFLDAVDACPKGINYAGYIGHSALRTYVMGERAFTEQADQSDIDEMCRHVVEAVRSGAIGFSTSRTFNHQTADDRPVASRIADWDEVRQIVNSMGKIGKGVFEIAGEAPGRKPERMREYFDRLKGLAIESGVKQTWGMFSVRIAPEIWRNYFDFVNEAAMDGGDISIQVHSRALNVLFSFLTYTPYDKWELWEDLRSMSLQEQKTKLEDSSYRRKLVEIANREYTGPRIVGAEVRPPDWDWVFPMTDMAGHSSSMAEIARQQSIDPVELMINLSLQNDFDIFFRQPIANEDQDHVLEMMQHPRSLITFSDSGAHVSQIMDSSLQTHLLAYWVREREVFTLEEAIREITYKTAAMWGLEDRGLIDLGKAADFVIFDADSVAPNMPTVEHDLPAGARRLKQTATGILHTIVNGEILLTNNEYTGATSGSLLRI